MKIKKIVIRDPLIRVLVENKYYSDNAIPKYRNQ